MLVHLRPAIVLITLFVALTGIAYPLAITGIAQIAFSRQANGSLVEAQGRVIGSSLIGQAFASERYFHSRPSATSAADPSDANKSVDAPYNADNSSGSNLGPTSQKLIERVKADIDSLRAQGEAGPIVADAVTTSASGLDPHISPQNALAQVERVARTRGLDPASVRSLVAAHTAGTTLGLFGELRVNVLALNLALDALRP